MLWIDDDEWNRTDPFWRRGTWHILDQLKGRHTFKERELEKKEFLLPFFEGIYNVEVTKFKRIDKWKRWFTKEMIRFNVKAGYYEGGTWHERPIPVEGKGENSWDCDEDATYEMSFPGHPFRPEIKSTYQAALYFWKSMMESRQRYGSANWLPEKFRGNKIEVLK